MSTITAILSMLHQPPNRPGSADRLFRREPVLRWTLRRLAQSKQVSHRAVLCWEDQLPLVKPIAAECGAFVLSKSPRCALPIVEAVATALKWSDGWRGGLMGACWFDRGFHAAWFEEIRAQLRSDSIIAIDPDSALVDPALIDVLATHADAHPAAPYCFAPSAPGLCGILVRAGLLEQLSSMNSFPGRLLSYWPDAPGRDPISAPACVSVPAILARTPHRFLLDADRQVRQIERATMSLNGQLMRTQAESLVLAVNESAQIDAPRDVVLELNTRRATKAIFSPAAHLRFDRAELSPAFARQIFAQLSSIDDLRLTLSGVGDPLLTGQFFEILAAANESGTPSIHVETDLLPLDPAHIERLAASPIDILSVHLPATTPETYARMMGADRMPEVLENIQRFLIHRQKIGRSTPFLVPTFVKCRQNLHEMEAWYDHWLRTLGVAVIRGATDFADQIHDHAAADMSPPRRCPCRRLSSRMTILCDGRVVPCEEDVLGLQTLGNAGTQSILDIFRSSLADLRSSHISGQWDQYPVCRNCREWHRP